MLLKDDKNKIEFTPISRATYECIQDIKNVAERYNTLDALLRYGFYGETPENLIDAGGIIFKLAKPYLDKKLSQARYGNQNAKKRDKSPKNADEREQTPLYTKTETKTETTLDAYEVRRRRMEER